MQKKELRKHLLSTFKDQELKRWFDPLKMEIIPDENRVSITFPHSFFADWFGNSIQDKFEEQLGEFMGNGFDVRYKTPSCGAQDFPIDGIKKIKHLDFPYGHQFTFESFLVNQKNYFPLASAREVAKQETVSFNPFVICGENGSGKTHILKGIANEMSKNTEPDRIFLGTIEDISNIYHVKFSGDQFKAREYIKKFDCFLVDDFQRIERHTGLQQELVLIFNSFFDDRRQMVFCFSDKISSYEFLDSTLRSRLEGGLIVSLKQPDMDIRVKFIKQQCRLKKLVLTKEQILLLSQKFNDFRSLQGILIKLFAFKELVRKDLAKKDFERILTHSEDQSTPALTVDMIINTVAGHFKIPPNEIKGGKRVKEIAQARQIAMYLARQLVGDSFPALGRMFGGKDHSTVLYSVKKVQSLQSDDKKMKTLLMELKNKCLQEVDKY